MSNGNPLYVTSFLKGLKKTKKMVSLKIFCNVPIQKTTQNLYGSQYRVMAAIAIILELSKISCTFFFQ